jgi:hypothetical protein
MVKKFETFQCSICKRRVDKEFKPAYTKFPKCDITFECNGTLSKINETDVRTLGASFKEGVENWRPRGQQLFVSPELQEEQYVPISSTSDFKFVIGLDETIATFSSGVFYDKLQLKVTQIKNQSLGYTDFQFTVSQPTTNNLELSGVDSNLKAVTVSEENTVFVFLNGYQLFETDYTVGQDKITLRVPTPAFSKINVIVKERAEEVVRTITLTSNQSLKNLLPGAWSNVNTVWCPISKIDGSTPIKQKFVLYTLDNPNELGFNILTQCFMGVNDLSIKVWNSLNTLQMEEHSLSNNIDSVIGVFSNKLFTCKDRVLTSYFKLSDLRGVKRFLKFSKIRENYEWSISKSTMSQSRNMMVIDSYVVKNGVIQNDPILKSGSKLPYGDSSDFISELILNP